jgi:CheY-like chemotaxis protein
VVLAVRDTGAGMDEVTRARAFEPFFTTKAAGQGSGLGLAMVHGIVRAHEGTVVIESEPGAGTTVRCYFPLLAAELPGTTAVEDDVPMGAGEHVLVVDDEPSLSRLGERRLLDLGYRATALTDPRQALAVALAGEVDLVLTDFTMPQMTGLELARRLAEAGRATPVIMVSGHPSELGPEQLAGTHVRLVLRKPVSHAELAGALRRVLAPG